MKMKKRIKIGIATTFVIVILMSLCGSRFVFQKACVRRETSWLNMGTADDYIYNLLVDAYNIRKEKNETVTIKASDGINLVGHYYERDKNAPLIIFFHGLWSNGYVSGEPTYKITKNQGWNLLLVSMRAHVRIIEIELRVDKACQVVVSKGIEAIFTVVIVVDKPMFPPP